MEIIFTKLQKYLLDNLDIKHIDKDINIIDDGYIDSIAIAELAAFIEDEWCISIAPEEMIVENFQTIADMIKFIEYKK